MRTKRPQPQNPAGSGPLHRVRLFVAHFYKERGRFHYVPECHFSFMSLSSFQITAKRKCPFVAMPSYTSVARALGAEIHQAPVSPEFSNVISLSLNLYGYVAGDPFPLMRAIESCLLKYLSTRIKVSRFKER